MRLYKAGVLVLVATSYIRRYYRLTAQETGVDERAAQASNKGSCKKVMERVERFNGLRDYLQLFSRPLLLVKP